MPDLFATLPPLHLGAVYVAALSFVFAMGRALIRMLGGR